MYKMKVEQLSITDSMEFMKDYQGNIKDFGSQFAKTLLAKNETV